MTTRHFQIQSTFLSYQNHQYKNRILSIYEFSYLLQDSLHPPAKDISVFPDPNLIIADAYWHAVLSANGHGTFQNGSYSQCSGIITPRTLNCAECHSIISCNYCCAHVAPLHDSFQWRSISNWWSHHHELGNQECNYHNELINSSGLCQPITSYCRYLLLRSVSNLQQYPEFQ